jgi:hypothetical protein
MLLVVKLKVRGEAERSWGEGPATEAQPPEVIRLAVCSAESQRKNI